jgi:hypothetical protein
MLYRGRVAGQVIVTSNLDDLKTCSTIDIFISGIWQVYE